MLARMIASSARTAENLKPVVIPASAPNAISKDASATAAPRTTVVKHRAQAARTVLQAVSHASAQ